MYLLLTHQPSGGRRRERPVNRVSVFVPYAVRYPGPSRVMFKSNSQSNQTGQLVPYPSELARDLACGQTPIPPPPTPVMSVKQCDHGSDLATWYVGDQLQRGRGETKVRDEVPFL